jgi:uncharacterized protein (UPF0261 family)
VPTYSIAREAAPTAFLIANIGISQLLDQPGEPALRKDDVARVIEMVRADALADATTLEQYNSGVIGPGHCDDDHNTNGLN